MCTCLAHLCFRTAQGHKLRDQARVDSAAAIVDSVFRRLLKSEYAPAVTAAHKLRQQGQFTDSADADDQGPNKRPRIGNPLMPHHRAFGRAAGGGSAGARSDVDEVITAFANGEEDIGPSNTKVRCVCTQHVRKEPMLQCEGPFCGVWQHAACVKQQLLHSQLVPHPPGSDKWPKRRQFFCERCRCAVVCGYLLFNSPYVAQAAISRCLSVHVRAMPLGVSALLEAFVCLAGAALGRHLWHLREWPSLCCAHHPYLQDCTCGPVLGSVRHPGDAATAGQGYSRAHVGAELPQPVRRVDGQHGGASKGQP